MFQANFLHTTQNFILDLEEHTDFDLPNHVAESVISDQRIPCVGHDLSVQAQSMSLHFYRKQLFLLQRVACQMCKVWEGCKVRETIKQLKNAQKLHHFRTHMRWLHAKIIRTSHRIIITTIIKFYFIFIKIS